MVENKKIEQDLREIDIRIKDLKVNRNCGFGKFALYNLSGGTIITLIPDNDIMTLAIKSALFAINITNGYLSLYSISDKNKQIRNLKYLKKYLQSHDISKIDIDKLQSKIESMNKNDKNKSNLEFLKHYLENSSLSHDDMEYKELARKSK